MTRTRITWRTAVKRIAWRVGLVVTAVIGLDVGAVVVRAFRSSWPAWALVAVFSPLAFGAYVLAFLGVERVARAFSARVRAKASLKDRD